MIELKDLVPGRTTHPGEMLALELDSLNLSQHDFALQIGMQKSQLNEIIKGKRSVNAETAILIAKALGGEAQTWLNAQLNYDLDTAIRLQKVQERSKALEIWGLFKQIVGVAYLRSQKYLTGDPIDDVPAVRALYNVESPDELAGQLTHSHMALFRKSQRLEEDKVNVLAWVKMVEFHASKQVVAPFNRHAADEVIADLRQIILQNVNVLFNVQHTLNSQGIKFVYQPKAEKAPIDGMSCWSGENPAIGMSLRSSRLDNFAFTLLHELGHVYCHLAHNPKICFYDNLDYTQDNLQEKEANAFAQECILPESAWKKLIASAEQFNQNYIIRFANAISTHPAVIAGQVCYRTGHYKWRRSDINNVIG